MPGYLLHVDATVICAHGGRAQATAPSQRVKVDGKAVVVQPKPHSVLGCPSNVPCLTGQWITASTRIRVERQPVLLRDSQSTCIPNGTPLTVVSTQTRVKGA